MRTRANIQCYSLIKRINAIGRHINELATTNNELYKQNRRLEQDNKSLAHRNNDLKAALNQCINLANDLMPRENHFKNEKMREFLIVLNKR